MGRAIGNSITLTDWSNKLVSMVGALSVDDGGFSVDPRTGKDVHAGYSVAVHPEHERVLGHPVAIGDLIAYMLRVADALSLPGRVFGGWCDPTTGTVYLDVSAIMTDYSDAVALARENDQVAIFDFAAMESIRVEHDSHLVE